MPRWWLLVSIASSIWILGATFGGESFMWLVLPTFSFLALVSIWTGSIFMRLGASHGLGAKVVGVSFVLWGLHKLDYPFLQPVVWFAPWGYLLGAILALITSVGIILVYFQKAKNDLIQSEERYRQTFEGNQAIKLILDPEEGSIIDANQAACEFYGYSRAEMTTKKIFDFNMLPLEEVKAKMVAVAKGGPARFPFPHRLASGVIRDVEVFSGPIRYQDRILLHSIVFDVTERKRAEDALRESEEKFRSFSEQSIVGIYLFKDGVFTYVNPKFAEIFGYTVQECMDNIQLSRLVHPDDLPLVNERVRRRASGEEATSQYQVRGLTKDGRVIHIEIHGTAIQQEGELVVMGAVLDITDRKRAEERLRHQTEELQLILDTVPAAIWFKDRGNNVLRVNKATCEMMGMTAAQIEGKHAREVFPEWLAEKYYQDDLEVVNSGQPKMGITEQYVDAAGQLHWANTDKVPWYDEQGNLTGILAFVVDITERKHAVEALQEREEKYRNLFNNAEVGMFRTKVDGSEILDCNEKYLEIFGYSREEMLNSPAVIYWADPHERQEMVRRLNAEGRVKDYECGMLDKNGEVKQCLTSLRLFKDQGILEGSIIDITDRKKVEEDLRASEAHFHSLFDNMLNGYAYCRMRFDHGEPQDFIYLDVNKAFEKLTGLKDVAGKWVSEVIPGIRQSDPKLFATYGDVAMSGHPTHFEHYVKALDMWFSVSVYCPQKEHFVSVFDVITERKRAEAELRASERRNRRILHSAMDGFWRLDAQRRIMDVNEAYCSMSGYSREELLTMRVRDLDAQETSKEIVERGRRMMKTGSDRFLSKHRRKDGSLFDVEVSVQYEMGEDAGEFAVFLRDISEQRRIEAQLRQAQKMEALGTLAGGIAHDFNNILGGVMGFAEISHEDAMAGQADPKDIQQIITAAQRAKELVKQILTFGRKNEPALQPFSLNQACRKARNILGRTIPKMIAIECDLADGLAHVAADPTQIEQVLLNLCSNAADAMPDGGRLVLATRALKVDEGFRRLHPQVPPGNYVLLTVSDTGAGMDPDTREHIFEPFFTTKEVGQGTGLGLSTAYGIVKSHGGFIFCYSEPGQGTTFSIYLPVMAQGQPESQAKMPADKEVTPTGTETILLADDENALRAIATRVLRGAGYQVLEASSGEEALKIYDEQPNPPDLVITDVGMPGMGGHKAMLEIFARHPGAKVVIVSGYADHARVKACLEAGAAAYITKPFHKTELLTMVRSVLDGQ